MTIDPKTAARVLNLLRNLTKENHGWRRWLSRWKISHEPLRGDATDILEQIRRVEKEKLAFGQIQECAEKYSALQAAFDRQEQPKKDTLRMICDIPLQEGDWAVECANPGYFIKVHPDQFGKPASNPAYSFFRANQ